MQDSTQPNPTPGTLLNNSSPPYRLTTRSDSILSLHFYHHHRTFLLGLKSFPICWSETHFTNHQMLKNMRKVQEIRNFQLVLACLLHSIFYIITYIIECEKKAVSHKIKSDSLLLIYFLMHFIKKIFFVKKNKIGKKLCWSVIKSVWCLCCYW